MDRESLLQFVRTEVDRPMRMKELARQCGVPQDEYPAFRRLVKQLVDAGELARLKGGRIGLTKDLNVVIGTISVTRKGMGFVEREGDRDDLLIPQADLDTALDGDRVMVRLAGRRYDRDSATVIRVLDRADRNIVGTFNTGRAFKFVVPDNPRIHRDIYIAPDLTRGAKDGEKVVVVITAWDHPWLNPEGKITERLGFPGQPGVDMLAVMRSFNLPDAFPPEALDVAEQAAARLSAEEFTNRLDLTNECIYTIDPADAKDHDDAISVERIGSGYKLGVHIADVAYFVESGTALDDEAFERGNSVYLPGMVIPMLPESLSNDVCSLKPNRRRLAHSVFMQYDKQGVLKSWEFADTVIKSSAKLSYEEVQDYFDGKTKTTRIKRVADNLDIARELAGKLFRQRMKDGSLDFDLPEAKIILNAKGEVIELGNRIRLESHRLVEECMLSANRAVALETFRAAKPFLYRVHDRPDMERLEAFSDMMKRLGHSFTVSKSMRPVQFSKFLDRIKDEPEADFINELLLRSMQKAVYQRDNIGHFGLAFSHYTHFTSPIRRYPDLLVHRMLRKLRYKKYHGSWAKRAVSVIDNVGNHCSETERIAETAERQAIKVKQIAYMAKHLGEEFKGIISGVTTYGFFVRLDDLGVEGLVKMSAMDDDYYLYEENNYRIVGRRRGQSYRLGDAVSVKVLSIDAAASELDFSLSGTRRKPEGKRVRNTEGTRKKKGRRKGRS